MGNFKTAFLGNFQLRLTTGEEFLKHNNPNEFGLIIINVQLGDVDGLKLCETIRNKGIDVPILFLTTSFNQEQCSCVDAMDILNKPFSLKDLLSKVEQMLLLNNPKNEKGE
ncbi:response regulator [Fictibacillus gelatini]|uniref:response regulator n=1 Tax=Fictibacillus gelatini TaxID=225985 RepID=UPI00041ECE3E|nr:response regulator [Fictibacillus gelatini]